MNRIVPFCLTALAVFMVITRPEDAADLIVTILGHLNTAAQAMTTFLTSLDDTGQAVG